MTEPKYGRRMDGKLHQVRIRLVLGWITALLVGGISLPQAGALTVLPSRINGPIQSGADAGDEGHHVPAGGGIAG